MKAFRSFRPGFRPKPLAFPSPQGRSRGRIVATFVILAVDKFLTWGALAAVIHWCTR